MKVLLSSAVLFLLLFIVWRLASRRHSIPCPAWLGWLVELDNPFTRVNRAAVIIGQLDIRPGMSVLDAGCGPGRLTVPAAKEVGSNGRVSAVDVQEGMLRRARGKAEAANLRNIRFIQGKIGEGILGKDEFDRALLVTVLGEIPDRETAFEEIFEALKPGGILSVTEIIFDPHFQPRGTVKKLALETGFREKAFFGSPIAYTIHLEKPQSR